MEFLPLVLCLLACLLAFSHSLLVTRLSLSLARRQIKGTQYTEINETHIGKRRRVCCVSVSEAQPKTSRCPQAQYIEIFTYIIPSLLNSQTPNAN